MQCANVADVLNVTCKNNDKEIIQNTYGNVVNKFHKLSYFGKAIEFEEDY